MKTIIVFVIFAAISESFGNDRQFCNLDRCKGFGHHILCPDTPKKVCNFNVLSHGYSQPEKDEIVKVHNELRAAVVSGAESRLPRALSMEIMTWDDELARMAQTWTDQCQIGHNECSHLPDTYIGQNFVMTPSDQVGGSVSIRTQILKWYDEIEDFDVGVLQRPFKFSDLYSPINKKQVGHLTQLLWAKTKKVGCGRIIYEGEYGHNMYFMVCNYGPAGNVEGEKIYELASSSSQPQPQPQQKPQPKPTTPQKTPPQQPIQRKPYEESPWERQARYDAETLRAEQERIEREQRERFRQWEQEQEKWRRQQEEDRRRQIDDYNRKLREWELRNRQAQSWPVVQTQSSGQAQALHSDLHSQIEAALNQIKQQNGGYLPQKVQFTIPRATNYYAPASSQQNGNYYYQYYKK